ncbi:MAG TPA: glycosyltransferase family 2 protein [Chitinophagaceae bacterium]|nr:glycosyltransferase family 2 protein [Chitinophagaceae bacterium]
MTTSQTDITIIVPFLNEEDNIERLGSELLKFTEARPDLVFEIILINDGSTDSSVNTIRATKFPLQTKLISFSQNFGSHAALRAGIMHSKGGFITFLYADLQDPIENITTMYAKEIEGNDIVWANRSGTQNSFFERQFSKFYSRLMKKYVNKRYPAKGFDVVLFNRKVADAVNKNVEGNSSVFLQILNLGFKQDFVEYQKAARKAGKSKWTVSKKIKLLIDSFVAFSFAPIRLVSFIGILFFIAGVIWTGYIVFRKLVFDDLASGWPALISILTIGFGITNISLGIIAEYLWRTLDASRKRPVFIIDEIIELDRP